MFLPLFDPSHHWLQQSIGGTKDILSKLNMQSFYWQKIFCLLILLVNLYYEEG